MSAYTVFNDAVTCTKEAVLWLFRLLDHLAALPLGEGVREVTPYEEALLGGEELHEHYVELKWYVLGSTDQPRPSAEYYEVAFPFQGVKWVSDGEGSVDFVVLALALLTAKYPQDYEEPLTFGWSVERRSAYGGGTALIYKGQVDWGDVDERALLFKEQVERSRLVPLLFDKMEKLDDETEEAVREAIDKLVHERASQVASNLNNAGLRAQIEYLLEEGCIHELEFLLGPSAGPELA